MWKGTFLNLIGLVIPSVIAIPAMAVMARMLGVEKFGLFMLAFSLLGYASIFDGGLTRSVIRAIAGHDNDNEKNKSVMGTATIIVMSLSVIAAVLVAIFSSGIVKFLNVTEASSMDAYHSFQLLSIVIPVYLVSVVWFAYLEGRQLFFSLNIYKVITGSIIAIFPILFVYFERTLFSAILGLLFSRLCALGLAFYSCMNGMRGLFFSFKREECKRLLSFGGWITFSNIISPLMVYADRFLLSNMIGANQVAFYTAPAEAIARMGIVPGALSRTIFPLFSKSNQKSGDLAKQAYKGLLIASLLMIIPVFIFSEFILAQWLGEQYGHKSALIMRVLLIGFFFNSLAQIPFSRIQAYGYAKLTAMIHLVELLPYIVLLAGLVYMYGITGAAVAWSLRVIFDFLILEYYSRRIGLK